MWIYFSCLIGTDAKARLNVSVQKYDRKMKILGNCFGMVATKQQKAPFYCRSSRYLLRAGTVPLTRPEDLGELQWS